jgi:glutamyl-tRNA reductase
MAPSRHPDNNGEDAQARGMLAVCGISHNTATLSEREPFQISRQDHIQALRELKSIRTVREAAILTTCNRFETYLVIDEGEEAFPILREFFIRFRGLDPKPFRNLFYVRHGSTVARHLFRVAGGLDSLVLGEYQIQSQVKEAYSAACSTKAPGKILHRLFHAAFRAGKAVRSRTAIGAGRMSVAGMAVGVIKERLQPEDAVLLVGVNENIRIVAEGLQSQGFGHFFFANRTRYKAEKLALRYGGEGFAMEELPALLDKARGVVSCTGSPAAVITSDLLESLDPVKDGTRLFVDMAVPRDIERLEPADPSIEFIDLEDLKALRRDLIGIRKDELPAAESIIEDMVAAFQCWMDGAFHPAVGALVKEFDRIRLARLEEALASFKPEDREALEHFSRALMQDLLRIPAQSFLEGNGNAPQ